jgi:hypothetical protein
MSRFRGVMLAVSDESADKMRMLETCNELYDNVEPLAYRRERLEALPSKEDIEFVAQLVFKARLGRLYCEITLLQHGVWLGSNKWEEIRDAADFLFDMSEARLPLIALSPAWDTWEMEWYTEPMQIGVHLIRGGMCLIEGEYHEACHAYRDALLRWPANQGLLDAFAAAKQLHKEAFASEWEHSDGEEEE